jgi:hypothetical protein
LFDWEIWTNLFRETHPLLLGWTTEMNRQHKNQYSKDKTHSRVCYRTKYPQAKQIADSRIITISSPIRIAFGMFSSSSLHHDSSTA